jgi:hypothetical protein
MPARHDNVDAVISEVRGQRIIIASDLARIYGVETKALNQAVSRNPRRFPADFAFRLTGSEAAALHRSRSQNVTLKRGQNLKYLPLAFTEHGAIMAASVLNSPRAIRMSVFVVRAFLRMREWVSQQSLLAARLRELENRVDGHDERILEIVQAIRRLIDPPVRPRRRIGFSKLAQ